MGWVAARSFEFEKELDVDISSDVAFDVEVQPSLFRRAAKPKRSRTRVENAGDITVEVDPDLAAAMDLDVEAIGIHTLAGADVSVLLIEDKLSRISGSVISAVGEPVAPEVYLTSSDGGSGCELWKVTAAGGALFWSRIKIEVDQDQGLSGNVSFANGRPV
jgi:hypothetical protein